MSYQDSFLVKIPIAVLTFLIGFVMHGKRVQTLSNDSLEVLRLLSMSEGFDEVNVDSAFWYAEHAQAIADRRGSTYLSSLVKDRKGVVLCDLGRWDDAIVLFDQAIHEFLKGSYWVETGRVYLHLGNLYYREGELHELREAFEMTDSCFNRAIVNYQLGLGYAEKAFDSTGIGLFYLNSGAVSYKLYDNKAALVSYKMAETVFQLLGNGSYVPDINSNIGLIYKSQGRIDSAAFYFAQARNEFINGANLSNWISVNLNLATVHEKQSPEQAIFYLKEADSLALIVGENVQRAIIQEYLYKIYSSLGETDKALMYLENYVALKDSLLNSDFKLEELNARYESRKQQELIEQQRNESLLKELALSRVRSERQALWIGFSFLLMLIGVLGGVWWYRKRTSTVIQKQKEKISVQRIEQLKKEQEVKTIEALLQGQEKERGRISEDLHDRLGSTLSAVRMQIEAYGDENNLSVEKLLKLVDRAIEETRSISHNLVSGVLSRFGLVAALEELQENFNVSQRIKIHLQSCEFTDFDSALEVELFRVIQELVNNALKHSLAKNVWVKLDVKEEWLLLVVRDDGVGFNINQPNYGMGLSNIKTRVARLSGVLDVKSHLGGGASFEIQIPLSNETNKYSYC